MAQARDWQGMKDMSVRLLKERTGEGVDEWNRRIKRERFDDEDELRAWLTKQGVTGYAQSLLVMERFGYPDFLVATADELIDGQYSDRPQLRPIFDALIDAAVGLGKVTIQARKTFVSLVSPRRTLARIQPTAQKWACDAWERKIRSSASRSSRSASATRSRWIESRSISIGRRSSASSGRTEPARRRRSRCSQLCCSPPRAGPQSWGTTCGRRAGRSGSGSASCSSRTASIKD